SPQSANWMETDWMELEITTVLVDQLYCGDTKLAGEIRQRVAKWGATNEDRARLRMSFEKKPEDGSESPSKGSPVPDMDDELHKRLSAVQGVMRNAADGSPATGRSLPQGDSGIPDHPLVQGIQPYTRR